MSFIRKQPKIFLLLFFSLVALIYTLPIYRQITYWGIQDWDFHFFFNGVPRKTLLEYGQVPLWNPYSDGGTVMLAYPESQFLTPAFLFVLLFGEVIGLKIGVWLHLVIGLVGAYALARHFQLSRPASILVAALFMLNSMYALSLTVGMTWYLAVVYLPWVFLFFLMGLSDLRYGLVSGFFLMLMFFTGAAYPLPMALLFLAVYSLLLVVFKEHSLFRVTKLLAVVLTFMLCLGAIKFLPGIDFQLTYPRNMYDYSGYSLQSLWFSLFSRDQSLAAIMNLPIEQPGFLTGVTGGMDENGMYIGFIPFVLLVVGIGLHNKRRMILFLTFLFFLWLSLGTRPPAELWTLLHLLPVYKAMRVAQRFRIIFMLCLAILAGFGFQTMMGYIDKFAPNRSLARFFTASLLGFVLIDLLAVSVPIFKDAFPIPPLPVTQNESFHHVWELPSYDKNGWIKAASIPYPHPFEAYNPFPMYSSYGSVYPAFLSNIGTINVAHSARVPRNARPISAETYRGEVYLKGTTGPVEIIYWSPNKLIIAVDPPAPGFLVVNQNYYAGWRARVGGQEKREVEKIDQCLAVRVFPGDQRVELSYLPTTVVVGLIVTSVTALFSIIAILRWIL